VDQFRNIFKEKGIQITRQRLEVYKVLKELNTHVTAEMVLDVLQQRGISMTVATVYNVLNLFDQKGLIIKVGAAGEPVIYDINTYEHIHICDQETRKVRDCPDSQLVELIDSYLQEHPIDGLQIERVDISLIGKDQWAHSVSE
jgi:Fe2+ or Zn2+ uptake regulation protein